MFEDFLIHTCEIIEKTPVNTGWLSKITETSIWFSNCRLWEPNQKDLRFLDKIKDVSLPVYKLYLPAEANIKDSYKIKINGSEYKIVYVYPVNWVSELHHNKIFISKD